MLDIAPEWDSPRPCPSCLYRAACERDGVPWRCCRECVRVARRLLVARLWREVRARVRRAA